MLSLVLVISILFSLTACSYVSYKDYYREKEDYLDIWSLAGFRHGYDGVSRLFPADIEELDVEDFFCRYDQQLPLGEGVQVFLEVKYSDAVELDAEIKRISSMAFGCNEFFESQNTLSAYSTRLGEEYSSEYALIDKTNQKIYYIYLQAVPKEEIEIDNTFLPKNYVGYGEIE